MIIDPLFIVGLVGSVLSLTVFFLNQVDQLSNKSIWYDSINALGAFFLVVYALDQQVWPFVITNAVWFLVSFRDVVITVIRS